jgi:hypothetical protein
MKEAKDDAQRMACVNLAIDLEMVVEQFVQCWEHICDASQLDKMIRELYEVRAAKHFDLCAQARCLLLLC